MTADLRKQWHTYRRDPESLFLFLSVCLAAFLTMLALLFIIIYILVKGIPYVY